MPGQEKSGICCLFLLQAPGNGGKSLTSNDFVKGMANPEEPLASLLDFSAAGAGSKGGAAVQVGAGLSQPADPCGVGS